MKDNLYLYDIFVGQTQNWKLIAKGKDNELHQIIHAFGDLEEKTEVNLKEYIQISAFYTSHGIQVDYNKWYGLSPQKLRNINIRQIKNIKDVNIFKKKYPEYFI